MAYVSVDIDLDDIDTDELVDEIIDRITTYKTRKQLTKEQRTKIIAKLKPLLEQLGDFTNPLTAKTLDDRMKFEHLESVWNKYSFYQIQNLLP